MVERASPPVLVVASAAELPEAQRVWGTGGWFAPEYREALDWLTLSRLMGWGVTVTWSLPPGSPGGWSGGGRRILLACDPDSLGADAIACLASHLITAPALVVARASAAEGTFTRLAGAAGGAACFAGRLLRWTGPGLERSWRCRTPLEVTGLRASDDTSIWATLDGAPIVAARRVGRGIVATLGFHPSRARDTDAAATALLKHLLIWGPDAPAAWLDFEGTLVLRMDDPGGAQNVHSRTWSYPKLGEAEWAAIGTDLGRRNARLSIGYVAGWVDDGDTARGALTVSGQRPARGPGRVHPSPLVSYQDRAGHAPGTVHDYEAEFRGIQALRAAGLGDVELHGYTHIHPDRAAWAAAADRYEAVAWYRELGASAASTIASRGLDEHPLHLAIATLHRYFGLRPTTLICPGDEWTDAVLARALDLGLYLASSYYLALRDGERFCWATHVCAPYLDRPEASWFDAGLPVVGYFHDREPALEGAGWIARYLDEWEAAGARRLIDFRELAGAVGRRVDVEQCGAGLRLVVTSEAAPSLVRALPITVRTREGPLPSRLSVSVDGRDRLLDVRVLPEGVGCVLLPPDPPRAPRADRLS